MIIHKNFIRFAAVCCFLSVITTLGIHAFFPDPPADFEERILLFRNKTYLLNRWWVIAHCLLVIVSMWGFALLQINKTPGSIALGFLFFCVFAIAEITRQMIVLFYTNGLREQYFSTTDPVIKDSLRISLSSSGLLTAPLFGVFILMFGLGCLCYGFSLLKTHGFSKLLSLMLIISAMVSFLFLANYFWKISAIEMFIEKFNLVYTPLLRALISIWLWKNATSISANKKIISPNFLQPVIE